MKVDLLFARFPYGNVEHPAVTNWCVQTALKVKADPRIGRTLHMEVNETPITMSRNRVMKRAQQEGVDLVCMIDSDMVPDLVLPGAKPFWETAFDWCIKHDGPCCVAAPYCGPPPHENPYAFRWGKKQSDHPNVDLSIDLYSREEAAKLSGVQECACLPTGLILIDVRCLEHLAPPWFDYEYADAPYNTEKATTEDCYFSRNCSLAGVPQYMAWDCWAGHYKGKVVGKPTVLTLDDVRAGYREAVQSGRRKGERLIDVKPDRDLLRHLRARDGEPVKAG